MVASPSAALPSRALTMTLPANVWRERHSIRSYEVNAARRMTVQTACNLFQEAAANQCHAAGVSIDQIVAAHRETWMLHRLCVRIHKPAAWRDEVTVETWPCGTERLYAIRDFRLLAADGSVLALASSAWLVIDLETRLPARRPKTPMDWRADCARLFPDAFKRKLALPETFTHARDFVVRRSDIDANAHANHVRVLEWALESAPVSDGARRDVSALDAEFSGEAFEGDTVRARCVTDGDGWAHRVECEAHAREILKARTTWSPPTDG